MAFLNSIMLFQFNNTMYLTMYYNQKLPKSFKFRNMKQTKNLLIKEIMTMNYLLNKYLHIKKLLNMSNKLIQFKIVVKIFTNLQLTVFLLQTKLKIFQDCGAVNLIFTTLVQDINKYLQWITLASEETWFHANLILSNKKVWQEIFVTKSLNTFKMQLCWPTCTQKK